MTTLSPDRPRVRSSERTLTGSDAVISLVAAVALLVPGILAFGPVFDGAPGYVPATGGVLLGLALAAVARWRRWPLATTIAAFIGAYLLFGGPLALRQTTLFGIVPTPETLLRLVPLSVQSWRDLLTVRPPAGSFVGPSVVPYLGGLLAGFVTAWFALSVRAYLAALLPAVLFLLVGILWGLDIPAAAGALGVALGVVGLLWAVWRRHRATALTGEEVLSDDSAVSGPRTLAAAAALVAGAAALSLVALPFLGSADRTVLRQYVQPPLDLADYPSPLTSYRYLLDDQREATLFTVTGLPEGGRVRLATLDAYDGHVYNVDQDSAAFLRIGPRVYGASNGHVQRLDVAVDAYEGEWVPGAGDVRGVRFAGPRAGDLADGLHYNSYGGTMLTTAGLRAGDSYQVDTVVPVITPGAKPERVSQAPLARVDRVPDVVGERATEMAGDATTPYDQLRAIERAMQDGYYLTGDRMRPGHSMERIGSMLTADVLVGDDEQYAVAMALMAHQLGMPARVVMGFHPEADGYRPEGLAVTGDMSHVWVEVPFDGVGWVTFDPTPDRDRVPQTTVPKPRPKPRPQVLPPPDPPINMLQDAYDEPGSTEDTDRPGENIVLRVLLTIALVLLGLALISAPFVIIGWLKSRRRERRRHAPEVADRYAGAWAEIEDAATDLGTRVPVLPTRQETALTLDAAYPEARMAPLATAVDAGVFGPGRPQEDGAAAVWVDTDQSLAAMTAGLSPWRRFRSFVSLRSFRRGMTGPRRPRLTLPPRKGKP